MTHTKRPGRALVGIAAAAVMLGAAQDAAAAQLRTTRLSATVSGTQTTSWSLDQTRYDGCIDGDLRSTGSGTERISFRSTRPAALDVVRVGRELVVAAERGLPVRGTIERQGAIRTHQLSGGESGCGGAPQPMAPPAPDCGTRSWSGTIAPVLAGPADWPPDRGPAPRGSVLTLTGPFSGTDRTIDDGFANCPGTEVTLEATPNARFDARRAFSGGQRLVLRGSDTVRRQEDGFARTVTVRWRAVLRRPAERAGAPQCSNGIDDDGDGRRDHPRDRQCRGPRDRSER